MNEATYGLATGLFSEVLAADQVVRSRLGKVLPKGMEISHFSVLNHLAHHGAERSPAELAKVFSVTRGAMTNTLSKLEWAGYVHVRPDWDDARRKLVAISPSGAAALEQAMSALAPIINQVAQDLGEDKVRAVIPVLREMRIKLAQSD